MASAIHPNVRTGRLASRFREIPAHASGARPPMLEAFASARVGDYAYCIGGIGMAPGPSGDRRIMAVARYHLAEGRWETVKDLSADLGAAQAGTGGSAAMGPARPPPRGRHACCAVGPLIYVHGGEGQPFLAAKRDDDDDSGAPAGSRPGRTRAEELKKLRRTLHSDMWVLDTRTMRWATVEAQTPPADEAQADDDSDDAEGGTHGDGDTAGAGAGLGPGGADDKADTAARFGYTKPHHAVAGRTDAGPVRPVRGSDGAFRPAGAVRSRGPAGATRRPKVRAVALAGRPARAGLDHADHADPEAGRTTTSRKRGPLGRSARAVVPSARRGHVLTPWCDAHGRPWLVLFGGAGSGRHGDSTPLSDVWAFSLGGSFWKELRPRRPLNDSPSSALDSIWAAQGEPGPVLPDGSLLVPPPRASAAGAVVGDSLFVFGGSTPRGALNDLWQFELTSRVWRRIHASIPTDGLDGHVTAPSGVPARVPPPRYGHAAVPHPWVADRIIVLGGRSPRTPEPAQVRTMKSRAAPRRAASSSSSLGSFVGFETPASDDAAASSRLFMEPQTLPQAPTTVDCMPWVFDCGSRLWEPLLLVTDPYRELRIAKTRQRAVQRKVGFAVQEGTSTPRTASRARAEGDILARRAAKEVKRAESKLIFTERDLARKLSGAAFSAIRTPPRLPDSPMSSSSSSRRGAGAGAGAGSDGDGSPDDDRSEDDAASVRAPVEGLPEPRFSALVVALWPNPQLLAAGGRWGALVAEAEAGCAASGDATARRFGHPGRGAGKSAPSAQWLTVPPPGLGGPFTDPDDVASRVKDGQVFGPSDAEAGIVKADAKCRRLLICGGLRTGGSGGAAPMTQVFHLLVPKPPKAGWRDGLRVDGVDASVLLRGEERDGGPARPAGPSSPAPEEALLPATVRGMLAAHVPDPPPRAVVAGLGVTGELGASLAGRSSDAGRKTAERSADNLGSTLFRQSRAGDGAGSQGGDYGGGDHGDEDGEAAELSGKDGSLWAVDEPSAVLASVDEMADGRPRARWGTGAAPPVGSASTRLSDYLEPRQLRSVAVLHKGQNEGGGADGAWTQRRRGGEAEDVSSEVLKLAVRATGAASAGARPPRVRPPTEELDEAARTGGASRRLPQDAPALASMTGGSAALPVLRGTAEWPDGDADEDEWAGRAEDERHWDEPETSAGFTPEPRGPASPAGSVSFASRPASRGGAAAPARGSSPSALSLPSPSSGAASSNGASIDTPTRRRAGSVPRAQSPGAAGGFERPRPARQGQGEEEGAIVAGLRSLTPPVDLRRRSPSLGQRGRLDSAGSPRTARGGGTPSARSSVVGSVLGGAGRSSRLSDLAADAEEEEDTGAHSRPVPFEVSRQGARAPSPGSSRGRERARRAGFARKAEHGLAPEAHPGRRVRSPMRRQSALEASREAEESAADRREEYGAIRRRLLQVENVLTPSTQDVIGARQRDVELSRLTPSHRGREAAKRHGLQRAARAVAPADDPDQALFLGSHAARSVGPVSGRSTGRPATVGGGSLESLSLGGGGGGGSLIITTGRMAPLPSSRGVAGAATVSGMASLALERRGLGERRGSRPVLSRGAEDRPPQSAGTIQALLTPMAGRFPSGGQASARPGAALTSVRAPLASPLPFASQSVRSDGDGPPTGAQALPLALARTVTGPTGSRMKVSKEAMLSGAMASATLTAVQRAELSQPELSGSMRAAEVKSVFTPAVFGPGGGVLNRAVEEGGRAVAAAEAASTAARLRAQAAAAAGVVDPGRAAGGGRAASLVDTRTKRRMRETAGAAAQAAGTVSQGGGAESLRRLRREVDRVGDASVPGAVAGAANSLHRKPLELALRVPGGRQPPSSGLPASVVRQVRARYKEHSMLGGGGAGPGAGARGDAAARRFGGDWGRKGAEALAPDRGEAPPLYVPFDRSGASSTTVLPASAVLDSFPAGSERLRHITGGRRGPTLEEVARPLELAAVAAARRGRSVRVATGSVVAATLPDGAVALDFRSVTEEDAARTRARDEASMRRQTEAMATGKGGMTADHRATRPGLGVPDAPMEGAGSSSHLRSAMTRGIPAASIRPDLRVLMRRAQQETRAAVSEMSRVGRLAQDRRNRGGAAHGGHGAGGEEESKAGPAAGPGAADGKASEREKRRWKREAASYQQASPLFAHAEQRRRRKEFGAAAADKVARGASSRAAADVMTVPTRSAVVSCRPGLIGGTGRSIKARASAEPAMRTTLVIPEDAAAARAAMSRRFALERSLAATGTSAAVAVGPALMDVSAVGGVAGADGDAAASGSGFGFSATGGVPTRIFVSAFDRPMPAPDLTRLRRSLAERRAEARRAVAERRAEATAVAASLSGSASAPAL